MRVPKRRFPDLIDSPQLCPRLGKTQLLRLGGQPVGFVCGLTVTITV
ncbi:MAG: hypothetical protein ABJN98_08230 [Roseibium sp.]